MKKALAVVFGTALLAAFCTKEQAPGLKLSPPEWTDNEVTHYQVLVQGEPSGFHTLTLNLGKSDGIETIELTALTEVTAPTGEKTRDSSWLRMRRDNLRPICSMRALVAGAQTLGSEITYTKDKASIKAMTPMGDKSLDIPVGPTDFDNDQVTTLLRAVVLKPDEEMELKVVVGLGGTTVPVKVKTLGTDKVTVPAGEFECNKLQMSLAGQTLNIWYETAGQKRMVKYEAAGAALMMELMPEPTETAEQEEQPEQEKPRRTGR